MKKKLSVILSVLMITLLVGGTMAYAGEADDAVYTVGICQLVQHNALDAATKGFRDALVEALGEDHVIFDEQNAAGDTATATTICTNLVSENVDLILANATPALQSAAAATNEIPILGTSITEYGVALEIDNFDGTVGGNISGTSDLAPLDQQAEMVKELFPDVKTVGILYCSGEANSIFQYNVISELLKEMGYEDVRLTDTTDGTFLGRREAVLLGLGGSMLLTGRK